MSKRRVVVVDDEEPFRDIVHVVLESQGIEAQFFNNGRAAYDFLLKNGADIIISDYQMPEMDGKELFLRLKEEGKSVPVFILMTGASDILSETQAKRMGVQGYLEKPFTMSAMLGLLTELDGMIDTKLNLNLYRKVPTNLLVAQQIVPYDIYHLLNKSKMIKLLHSGQLFSRERLDSYRKKKLKSVYIRKSDFIAFADFHLGLANKKQVDGVVVSKEEFTRELSEMIFDQAYLEGVDQELFTQSQKCMQQAVEHLASSEPARTLMADYKKSSEDLFLHSLTVATLSVMLAIKVGYSDPSELIELAMAGLFHDIGKSDLPVNLEQLSKVGVGRVSKDPDNHARKSALLIEQSGQATESLTKMVLQHENCRETCALKEKSLVARSHLLGVSNKLSNLMVVYKTKNTINVIDSMKVTEPYIPTQVIQCLKEIFFWEQAA